MFIVLIKINKSVHCYIIMYFFLNNHLAADLLFVLPYYTVHIFTGISVNFKAL